MYGKLKDFVNCFQDLLNTEKKILPLCAAENVSSKFVKLPLDCYLQEKYILGGALEYTKPSNFCGSDKLFNIYNLLSKQCNKMFSSIYADARTLSGINAVTTLLMSLFKIGDTIMISDSDYGGHSSMTIICERLGIKTINMPYDYKRLDFDYEEINKILRTTKVDGILVALSDMIQQPQLQNINLNETILIYDATQVLGLIATGYLENPFNWFNTSNKFILMGATHKTIPGPTCGLIMTKNVSLAKQIDLEINPNYLRNTQLNNITSLLFALYELEEFGEEYFKQMKILLEGTAYELTKLHFNVLKTSNGKYSHTHQLWLNIPEQSLSQIEENALLNKVSFNIRRSSIYKNSGIRLGFQQIARYNWPQESTYLIASIIDSLKNNNYKKTQKLISQLPPKKVHFTFDRATIDEFNYLLHDKNF